MNTCVLLRLSAPILLPLPLRNHLWHHALQLLEGGNMRRNVRLRTLYGDKRRKCYLFDNLHQLDTAASAGPEGTASGADLLAAADW